MRASENPRDAGTPPKPTGGEATTILARVLLSWSLFVCIGTFYAGPVGAVYGALTVGAVLYVVALCTGAVALLFSLFHFRDWRAWASLALCGVAVASSLSRTVQFRGP